MGIRITDEHIPPYVRDVLVLLTACRYQAYVVGGAPRDLLLGLKPKDFDIATDATPEQIKLCLEGKYPYRGTGEKHGTITACGGGSDDWRVEITTFRADGDYSDGRRPDFVRFLSSIDGDLARRDFTVNAIALRWPGLQVIDPFGGAADLRRRLIRAVGDPAKRFGEDGLRLMRAIRLRSERGWHIEKATYAALTSQSRQLERVSRERVRDEFTRVLLGTHVKDALRDMVKTGLIVRVVPEFGESIGFDQRTRHHTRKLDDHAIEATHWMPRRLNPRLAAFLHDIAKPRTFTVDDDGEGHFYGHNKIGADMTMEILRRLRYSKDTITAVSALVREHMFVYGPKLSDAGVRRLLGRVGKENIADLFELRRADIIASGGLPDPWLDITWDRVVVAVEGHEPLNTLDLAISGSDVMQVTGWSPGPKVGRALEILFERVIMDPALNEKHILFGLIPEIAIQVEQEQQE